MTARGTKPDKQARQMLLAAKLYSTRTRIAIVKVLLAAGRPLDKKEIAVRLGSNMPDAATVYRTLERLGSKGLVHRVYTGGRARRFELAHQCGQVQCHPHFTCRRCGITRCLTDAKVPLVKGLQEGYRLLRQQVRLDGICPSCQPRR
ncbi:MAG TPA: transcriptional repressor [Sedimentisphaerales bacterium]|nr:transcriptional repressor [Sedimentisphaerales bacterium]